jgi:DNA-binding LacI/PurR family transcriptional regulator
MLKVKKIDLARKFGVDPRTVSRWFMDRGKVVEELDDVVDYVIYMRHR